MNDREKVERAHRTRQILESAEFKSATVALRETLIAVMEGEDDERAMEARRQLRSMKRLIANLQAFLTDEALINADQAARRSRMNVG